MSDWVQLKKGNDWAVTYISYDPLRRGHASTWERIDVKEGELVDVRFPNGDEQAVTVVFRKFESGYSDHGHDHTVSYTLPGFVLSKNGVESWHDLATPGVLVKSDRFRTVGTP